jgi:formate dehydrogenase alpha subunit
MSEVRVILNGKESSGHNGMTIFELAEQEGVEIPSLCHSPDLSPAGVCRVCVVEVEGTPGLVASCHTPIAEGMVIQTRSAKVKAVQRANVELLLTGHTGSCVTDPGARNCHLHRLASDLEVGPPRFQVREPRYHAVEESNPYVRRDLSKCILCRKCTRACSEIAGKNVLGIGYRGSGSKLIVGLDDPLKEELCRDCGICIDYCPTGALSLPVREAETGGIGRGDQ